MILDPSREGCTIYIKNNITHIKGDPDEVCREIYRRNIVVKINSLGESIYYQIHDVNLDIRGIGILYKDILQKLGLKIYDLKFKNVDDIFPKIIF